MRRGGGQQKSIRHLILDLRKLTYITDYFVICSGSNTTQVSAIADWIGQTLAKQEVHPSHVEGQAESSWVLMDYGDVVVHIFDEQTRTIILWKNSGAMQRGCRSACIPRR